jgi:hypothetical protein
LLSSVTIKFYEEPKKDVDLSTALNLETVWHMGPSTIGIDTLFRSRGLIPEIFLRGCGVPEKFIHKIPELIREGDENGNHSCFISYSSKDEGFARKLHGRLVADGVRVWFAPHDMKGGRTVHDQIRQAIRNFDKTMLVISTSSMESNWVVTEIRNALDAENLPFIRKLFPIRLVPMEQVQAWKCFDSDLGMDLAIRIREYHIPDFSKWRNKAAFEKSYDHLLKALRSR